MAAPQAAGRFKEAGEEHITRLRGMTLFGIIKQMQHLCGVSSMIVSPLGALSPSGDKAPSVDTIMLATPEISLMVYTVAIRYT